MCIRDRYKAARPGARRRSAELSRREKVLELILLAAVVVYVTAAAAALLPRLEAVEPWTAQALESSVRTFAEETGRKLGKVAQPLRAALTGKATSPGIFDVLDVLGREESLARLHDQAAAVKSA